MQDRDRAKEMQRGDAERHLVIGPGLLRLTREATGARLAPGDLPAGDGGLLTHVRLRSWQCCECRTFNAGLPMCVRCHALRPGDPDPELGEDEDELGDRGRGKIRGWSAKSRARMVRAFSEIDWTPVARSGRIPATLTVTCPGDWLTVAPDEKAWTEARYRFLRRYQRAWGEPFTGVWKNEFQARGAPHWCAYFAPPWGKAGEWRKMMNVRYRPAIGDGLNFKDWVKVVWADCLNPVDRKTGERKLGAEEHRKLIAAGTNVDWADGMRYSDPRRVANYFLKHGLFSAKEYQNQPPQEWLANGGSSGRFWGILGLGRVTWNVDLSTRDYDLLGRTLRRYSRAQRGLRDVRLPRSPDSTTGVAQLRRVRRRTRYLATGTGFLCVNDGPAMAMKLAGLVGQAHAHDPPPVGMRGPVKARAARRSRAPSAAAGSPAGAAAARRC